MALGCFHGGAGVVLGVREKEKQGCSGKANKNKGSKREKQKAELTNHIQVQVQFKLNFKALHSVVAA